MPKTTRDYKKEAKEFEKRRGILESLLYLSTKVRPSSLDAAEIFPTNQRYIFNEVVRGSVEFVTGRESRFVCPTTRIGEDGKEYCSTRADFFEPNMWDYFRREVKRGRIRLSPEMRKTLFRLLEPHWSSDQSGDGEYVTELYQHFKGFGGEYGICPVLTTMSSTFSLTQSVVNHVVREVIPSFSGEMRDDAVNIARLMRNYIEQDLRYIKGHHGW